MFVDGQTVNLIWDEAGQLASDERFEYTYDALGRLVAVHHKHSGDLAEAYLYDSSDRLAAVIGPGGARQEFHRVDDQIVAAYDETGDVDWQAIWGPRIDQLLEWRDRDGSSDYIAMLDHRNSVVGTWDIMSGELDAIADYTADGRVTSRNVREEPTCVEEGNFHVQCDGPSGMPFGFNARWRSSVTGLTNMRARWYSARHGQFTSHDPLGYIDTQNLYAFAAFDPINGWDPYGLSESKQTSHPTEGQHRSASDSSSVVPRRGESILRGASGGGLIRPVEIAPAGAQTCSTIECVEGSSARKSRMPDMATGAACGVAGSPMSVASWACDTYATQNQAYRDGQQLAFAAELVIAGPKLVLELAEFGAKRAMRHVDTPNCAGGKCNLGIFARRGPECSFTSDTSVMMCDGSLQDISEVEEGEWVLTRDDQTGEVRCEQVVAPYHNPDRAIINVSLMDEAGDVETIETTFNHPFYVEGMGWTQVDRLREGDVIPSPSGWLQVVAVEWTSQYETVYNFGVEQTRSYFVGEFGAWVHNCISIDEKRAGHIFREADGHLTDTPANRELLVKMTNSESNLLGTDKWGNQWYASTRTDGTQVWTSVRDGKITNGGLNQNPRSFDAETGLSSPKKPKD